MSGDGFHQGPAQVKICRDGVTPVQFENPGEPGPFSDRGDGLAQVMPVFITFGNRVLICVRHRRQPDLASPATQRKKRGERTPSYDGIMEFTACRYTLR